MTRGNNVNGESSMATGLPMCRQSSCQKGAQKMGFDLKYCFFSGKFNNCNLYHYMAFFANYVFILIKIDRDGEKIHRDRVLNSIGLRNP